MVTYDWKKYTEDYNEGLGTVYERFMLNRILDRLIEQHGIKSVLEVPIYGMIGVPGINSVSLAEKGCYVTLVDDDRNRLGEVRKLWKKLGLKARFVYVEDVRKLKFKDSSFDLVWNFAALWHIKNASNLLREMSRVSSNLLLVSIPNRWQITYPIRKILQRDIFDRLHEEWNSIENVKSILVDSDVRIIEEGVFDIPPWPDICMPIGSLIKKEPGGWRWSMVDYHLKKEDYDKKIKKYSIIENSRIPKKLKALWAHHRYVVGKSTK